MKIIPFISNNSKYSRRKAAELVKSGIVRINNNIAQINQQVKESDKVFINGKEIKYSFKKQIFLIYKPKGYVSTTFDKQGRKTVLDIIPKQKNRLYPVGRLDIDSRGLMILTNDGEMTNKYTHPSFQTTKTYRVILDRHMSRNDYQNLLKGTKLKEGFVKPDQVKIIDNNNKNYTLEITLHEGKNREIRRMIGKLGYQIYDLERIQMGKYSISDLKGKSWLEVDN